VYPKPSASQTWRAVGDAQRAAPGEQTCGVHAPSRQPVPAAQAESVEPLPLAAQTRRVRASAQVTDAGAHRCGAHERSAVQYCPAPQSTSATQSTHTPRPVSHTCSKALHCREEVQGAGGATQPPPRHTAPPVQSGSPTQSTQRPAAVSHT